MNLNLPSSPPLLPEVDLPTIPSLALEESAELPVRPSTSTNDRPSLKRQFSDYDNYSSDAIFSEGTSEAEGNDQEDRRRRKRLVRGPWWKLSGGSESNLRQTMAKRRPLKVADSGVWMSSDGAEDSEMVSSEGQQMATLDVAPARAQAPTPLSAVDIAASKVIAHCLENGQQSVDLSAMGLTELSDVVLKPLHQLIRQTHEHRTQPPSEDEFLALTPNLCLFFSGNSISSAPRELSKLNNITVLSLRNNQLSEIPSGICRLPRLKELHVGQNLLKFLPWEMLDLLHCYGDHSKDSHRNIYTDPNPLIPPIGYRGLKGPSPLPEKLPAPAKEYVEQYQAWGEKTGAFFSKMKEWWSEDGVLWTMRHELELRLKLGRVRHNMHLQEVCDTGVEVKLCDGQLIYLASSSVRFFDVDGSFVRPTNFSIPSNNSYSAVEDPLANAPPASLTTSLYELALRSIQANLDLQLIPDDLPSHLEHDVRKAKEGREHGNESCHVCGKHYIIARAEWIEFWFNGYASREHLTWDTVLPFMRRVCSWQCAQPSDVGAIRLEADGVRGAENKSVGHSSEL